jgi:arylsulfate sulfotransferase
MGKGALLVFGAGAIFLLQGCGPAISRPVVSTAAANCTTAAAVSTSPEVAVTDNPQVAKYTYMAPGAGSVYVQFGTNTGYGRATSVVTAAGAGPVSVLVAGMMANTTYHMQAVFTDAAGDSPIADADQTFTTGGVPCKFISAIVATTAAGQVPQPGIEMLDGINYGGLPSPAATDLAGNIIWTYPFPDESAGVSAFPIRMLSNGDMLLIVAHNSSQLLVDKSAIDTASEIREINLAGDTVRSLPIAQLNANLAAQGSPLVLGGYSHDIIQLSNGHLIVIATLEKKVVLTGATLPTTVLGDALIDLDPNFVPVWTWNAFDHLDVNRHPFMFPDWTHANAVSYDPADGSLLFSLRHQNWILKINYANGTGDGAVDWRLGPGGDFTLLNASGQSDSSPEDWFYSQHYIGYIGTDASGVLTFSTFDNGDDRQFSDGTSCPKQAGAECYSTVPIMQVDPTAMTAKYTFRQILPASLYSFFGGNTDLLPDGHVHYDLASLAPPAAAAYEVTGGSSPQPVWSIQIADSYVYRASRWPSLYPGVQW